MPESALYVSPPSAGLGISLFADRAILSNPAGDDMVIPFSEIEALAYVEPSRIEYVGYTDMWFLQSGVRLAVRYQDEWIHLPAVPYNLGSELVSNWRKASLRIDPWPWDPNMPPPPSIMGTLLVRQYKNTIDFQAEAPWLARAGYEVISTTEQQQNASGAVWLLAGPIAAMAAKKTHLVVTYQLRQ